MLKKFAIYIFAINPFSSKKYAEECNRRTNCQLTFAQCVCGVQQVILSPSSCSKTVSFSAEHSLLPTVLRTVN